MCVRNEIKMHNVSNWHFYALQTEDEKGEGPHCLPMEINHCTQLLFANYFIFRTVFVEQPFDTAIRVWDSRDITFRNLHNYTQMQYVFSNTLSDWSNFHPYFSWFGKRGLVVYTIDPDDPYRSMQQLLPQKRNDFAPQTINCTIMQRTVPCLRRSNFRSASPVWPEIP